MGEIPPSVFPLSIFLFSVQREQKCVGHGSVWDPLFPLSGSVLTKALLLVGEGLTVENPMPCSRDYHWQRTGCIFCNKHLLQVHPPNLAPHITVIVPLATSSYLKCVFLILQIVQKVNNPCRRYKSQSFFSNLIKQDLVKVFTLMRTNRALHFFFSCFSFLRLLDPYHFRVCDKDS